ncbi:uncharacterized protein LOC144438607 [Glandiceps talaboti]
MAPRITKKFLALTALIPIVLFVQHYLVSRNSQFLLHESDKGNREDGDIASLIDERTDTKVDNGEVNEKGRETEREESERIIEHAAVHNEPQASHVIIPTSVYGENDNDVQTKDEQSATHYFHGDNSPNDGAEVAAHSLDTQIQNKDNVKSSVGVKDRTFYEDLEEREKVDSEEEEHEKEETIVKQTEEIDTHLSAMPEDMGNVWRAAKSDIQQVSTVTQNEELNSLLSVAELEELEKDEAWMWESYEYDGPCNICLAPVRTRPIAALASCPDLGSYRVRYMLEQATGIYTGSVYRDQRLFYGGFKAELMDYTYKNTVVVQTHAKGDATSPDFQMAILLIRNPFDVILEDLFRGYGVNDSHADSIDVVTGHYDWKDRVWQYLEWWDNIPRAWLASSKHMIVVNYEDFMSDPKKELEKMMNFLNVPLESSRRKCIEDGMNSHIPITAKGVKDDLKMDLFNAFDDDMRSKIHSKLTGLSHELAEQGYSEVVKRKIYSA